MKVRCPGCNAETEYEGNPYRPFCSERCRLLDLGNWLSGAYGVPVHEEAAEPPKPDKDSDDR
jgi:endogenous inhibitor of DNA gyrase (YacG/DUF329 family)